MAPNPEPVDDFFLALDPVRAWAGAVSGLPVVHDFDDAHAGDGAVVLRPLELEVAAAAGPVLRHISSAELTLGALVTTVGLPLFPAAGTTSALALAAAAEGEWRMDAAPPSLELWRALQRAPAPAFILRVPVRRLLERPTAPLVRQPVRLVPAHLRTVVGRIVATDGRPLGAAQVGLADTGGAVETDHGGRFRLPVATAEGAPLRLSVRARGASITLAVDAPPVDTGGDLGDLTVHIPESV
ncbi:hypothetical protein NQ156_04485 [Microbacterium sp. zg.Y625]|uniref:hypothetical protein n=1 Tax=Microbacterium jiangjiandongii TaxID=3049071 RepID=UPI00214BEEAE|nr:MULTISPECIES: hypothetical protein [unclassified Microbacterium]MCR2792316.1 hypothetical protein [Microbacterium sp. zg.Y625]WIM25111.1 hypothetical protein QNO14_13390 [Microbacterium sp. zg-Y625]